MKGGFGCSPCCGPTCEQCTRTCTEPHTGDAFEAVYTRYFEGAETGNVSDGYLTASGDSDTSDPYNGMDGSGPWFQQITGGFTLNSTQTRFPCRVLVSFWRNNYTLGAATIPPASTALTSNKIYVTVSAGAVIVGDRIIVPADGEVHIEGSSIPLVSGGGDQSESIPRFYEGSISVVPQCESASFSIRARIEWNTQKRQHVLYGLVRECYDTPDPENPEVTSCDTFCNGDPAPSEMYLTLSGVSTASEVWPTSGGSSSPSMSFMNGTYIVSPYERNYAICDVFLSGLESGASIDVGQLFRAAINLSAGVIAWPVSPQPVADTWISGMIRTAGITYTILAACKKGRADVCSSTSGTGSLYVTELPITASSRFFEGSFSWSMTP